MNAGLLYQDLLLSEPTEAVMAKQGLRAWGAPANMSAHCLGSLSEKAAGRAALSTTYLRSVQDPCLLSLSDEAQSMVVCQHGQATWTSR